MSEIAPPEKEEIYRISELTADGITFRNRNAWPFIITHAEWEAWGRPSALRIAIRAMGKTAPRHDTMEP